MAIVKFVNTKPQIKKLIAYANKKEKVYMADGKDCTVENFYDEVKFVKNLYNKNKGREFIHIVQAFPKNEKNINLELVHSLGMQLAEYFSDYQVLVVTHKDKGHLHSHLILNSVNFRNGKKFHQSNKELQMVKDYSNELCVKAGLTVITKKSRSVDIKINEYMSIQKGQSWKAKLISDIEEGLKHSKRKFEFINYMNEKGYKVNWKKERKYITYTLPNGKKCRDKKLHNQKYLKENMDEYFNKIKNIEKEKYEDKEYMMFLFNQIIARNQDIYNENLKNGSEYKGDLSKQAKKDYAINKANESSIDWNERE